MDKGEDIGGFFPLELPKYKELHDSAIRLNTGRNAFEYILKAYDVNEVRDFIK